MEESRRGFILGSSAALAGTIIAPVGTLPALQTKKGQPSEEEDVSTNEDLMREHGVLNRVLLIYDEANRRISTGKPDLDPQIVTKAAGLIKKFIEEYHEKLEENYLFPRFEKANKLADLTRVLRAQHAAGRTATDRIISSVKSKDLDGASTAMTAFVRMYRPHEAREDTVLFPALHSIVSKHEYDALGEEFDKIEQKTFGGDGFDMAVDQVTALEKQMGIYDLSQFTPK
jgi:hemerythrin-like domain-containing protein